MRPEMAMAMLPDAEARVVVAKASEVVVAAMGAAVAAAVGAKEEQEQEREQEETERVIAAAVVGCEATGVELTAAKPCCGRSQCDPGMQPDYLGASNPVPQR